MQQQMLQQQQVNKNATAAAGNAAATANNSNRYKTELCRPFQESGTSIREESRTVFVKYL